MDSQSDATPSQVGRPKMVREIMRAAVTTVERHAHLAAAAYQMKHAGDNAVVVTTDDESMRPIAIVTESDIMNAVADGKDLNVSRIEELAGSGPVVIESNATVHQAAELMFSAGVRHLPVVEDGRLVGIVDVADACRAMLDVS